MTHETRARRVGGWIELVDCTLPVTPAMALEDIDLCENRKARTRVSYEDGRFFETVASRRAILRAMLATGDDDAITFEATIGTPQELPT